MLSVDPGNNAGAGIFAEAMRLQAAGLLNLYDKPGGLRPLDWLRDNGRERFNYLAIEIPRISKQTAGKDPNSIVKLGITCGRIIERYPHKTLLITHVETWKGNQDKDAICAVVIQTLYDTERLVIPDLAKSVLHNVIEGIGIGLRANGRMLRGKVKR